MSTTKKKKSRRKRRPVIQEHHITYEPEWTVKLFKGEHWICTQLQRRRKVSQGFLKALTVWILENEANAENLDQIKT